MGTPDEVLTVEARLVDDVTPAVNRLGRKAKTAFDKIGKAAQKASQRMSSMVGKIVNVKNAIIGLAAVKGIQMLFGSVAKLGDGFDKMSQRLNVTTDFLQEMDFVAGQAGTSFQALEGGMRRLARNANDANDGLAASKRAFDDIGVSVQQANGMLKTSEQLFNDTIDGLAALEDKTKQTALAQVLFGRSGAALIPILNQGKEAIAAQRQEARDLGIVMGKEGIAAAVAYTDSMDKLSKAFRGIQANLITPALAAISLEVEKFLKNGGVEKIKVAVDNLIIVGKIFFIVFAATKIIAIGQAMLTAAAGVRTLGLAMKALSLSPLLIALTAVTTAVVLMNNAADKAASRGIANFNQQTLETQRRLLAIRKAFAEAAQETIASSNMMSRSWGQQTTVISAASVRAKALGEEYKKLTGFAISSGEGVGLTTKAMEESIVANEKAIASQKELNAEKKKSEGGGSGGEAAKARVAAAQKLADEISNIELNTLKRTSKGRLQILDDQQSALIARTMGNQEQIATIEREFALQKKDEELAQSLIDGEEKTAFMAEEAAIALELQGESHTGRMDLLRAQQAELLAQAQKFGVSTLNIEKSFTKKIEKEQMEHAKFEKGIAQGKRNLLANELQGRMDFAKSLIGSLTQVATALGLSAKSAKKIALAESIVFGALAIAKAAASLPFPANVPGVILQTAMAAANTATIASQAFQAGGFPVGANANIRVNEGGQEAVLNAQATASLGSGAINRLNAGGSTQNTVTNEISYSPTFQLGQGSREDFIDLLKEDKENFANFIQEDLIDKGFLQISQ